MTRSFLAETTWLFEKGTRQRLIAELCIMLVAGTMTYYATSTHGLGLTSDSVGYIRAARDMLALRGVPLVYHPPLYSFLLFVSSLLTGMEPFSVAHWLNIILVCCTVILAFRLLEAAGTRWSFPVLLSVVATLLCSASFAFVSRHALSELPFIVLSLLFLLLVHKYQEKPSRFLLVLVAATAALLPLTRYVGVFVIPFGIYLLWTGNPVREKARDYRGIVMYSVIATLPILLWVGKNLFFHDTLTGHRVPSTVTFPESVQSTLGSMGGWFLPRFRFQHLDWLAPVVGGVVVVSVTLLEWVRTKGNDTRRLPTVLQFFFVQTSALVILQALVGFDQIGSRLLAPSAILLGLSIAMLMARLSVSGLPPRFRVLVIAALSFFFVFWLVPGGVQSYRSAVQGAAVGYHGFSHVRWKADPLIEHIQRHVDDLPEILLSNETAAIAMHTEIRFQRPTVRVRSLTILRDPRELRELAGKAVAVVLFDGYPRNYEGVLGTGLLDQIEISDMEVFSTGRLIQGVVRKEGHR